MGLIELTPYQVRKITEILRHTDDVEAFRRAQMLRDLHYGKSVKEIAAQLAVTAPDVYYLIRRLRTCDDLNEFLQRRPGSGRPSVWTAQLRRYFESSLRRSPESFVYFARGWTA